MYKAAVNLLPIVDRLAIHNLHGNVLEVLLISSLCNLSHNLLLVVCGSATSWMLDNIINNKGGLYGRLTGEMKLSPFTLKECDEFFKCRGIKMSKYNVLQAYMALGGIPFYLNMFNAAYSLPQNIDSLFFERNAKLGDEFDRLFNSIFDNADDCMKIVRLLGTRHSGYTRKEIVQKTGLSSNGDLTKMLKALVGSDFVVKYVPFGASSRDEHYKLIDSFCWFWLHFKESKRITQPDYWQCHVKESEISAWHCIRGSLPTTYFTNQECIEHRRCVNQRIGLHCPRRRTRRYADRPAYRTCRRCGKCL